MSSQQGSGDNGSVCLFTKPVIAGRTKTRLAESIGAAAAARLAEAFLIDTYQLVKRTYSGQVVLCLSENGPLPRLEPPPELWSQGTGDLGERMERVFRRALEPARSWVIVIGSDSPGLPPSYLARAISLLDQGHDAVLGPAADGGYYLLGLRRCPPALLTNLRWSTSESASLTLARLRLHGYTTTLLPSWFDVDVASDLERLGRLLARGGIHAPHTALTLDQLNLSYEDQPDRPNAE